MRKLLLITVFIVLTLFLGFASLILAVSVTDYKPGLITPVDVNNQRDRTIDTNEISILIWNIGYAGLDESMDFFYDGGAQVRPPKENVLNNVKQIARFIQSTSDSISFYLFQELDVSSKRSYHLNQYDSIQQIVPTYESYFGTNYDVLYVPMPPTNPMGKVKSGLSTFSTYAASSVTRHTFTGNYDWPKSLFLLDRCFLLSRYSLGDTSELVIINTHNSAYDDGELRSQQLKLLQGVIELEYNKGNYVVVGGDWNMCPPNFTPSYATPFDTINLALIPDTYLPHWQWVNPSKLPTNRRVSAIYEPSETLTTTIDFFLLSPNIKSVDIKTVDLKFKNSDHQPVYIKIQLQ